MKSSAVEGGYVEGNQYTDEELKFLAKDYIDFEYEDQTEPEPSNLPSTSTARLSETLADAKQRKLC